MTTKTPQRPTNNNYAAPHTPIASAKRPRSSMDGKSNSVMKTPSKNASQSCRSTREEALSPMHPASHPAPPRPIIEEEGEEEDNSSWVNRKMDALFSPVLSFLGTQSTKEGEEDVISEHCPEEQEEEPIDRHLDLSLIHI